MMSRFSAGLARAIRDAATVKAARPPLKSIAPRPQMSPPRTSPANGSTDHRSRSTPTTSSWPASSSGLAVGLAARRRAMKWAAAAAGRRPRRPARRPARAPPAERSPAPSASPPPRPSAPPSCRVPYRGHARLTRLGRERRVLPLGGRGAAPLRLDLLGLRVLDVGRPAEALEQADQPVGRVELTRREAVLRRRRERMVRVVPALAERDERDGPVVAALVLGLERALAVHVADRVDAPRRVVQQEHAHQAGPDERG